MCKRKFPSERELAWAILDVLKDCHRPIAKRELPLLVARKLSLHPKVIDCPHKDGSVTKLYYWIGWILTKLKIIGAVENVQIGHWALTKARGEFRYRTDLYHKIVAKFGPEIPFRENWGRNRPKPTNDAKNRKLAPIESLRKLNSKSFENICRTFLEKSEFSLISVTERTKNGFDGNGILRINFMSFRVFFRCRKSADSIDQSEIRTFRRTISGRAEKGLYITTGTFNESALKAAEWDNVPVIKLINGAELCSHLNRLGLEIWNQE